MKPVMKRGIAVLCMVAALAACGASRRYSGAGPNRDILTPADFAGTHHPNAFYMIQALRPHWLEVRGGTRDRKQVYLDDVHMGGLEQLRQVPLTAIEYIRYYDGPSATQLWGVGHAAGAIQIRMRRS